MQKRWHIINGLILASLSSSLCAANFQLFEQSATLMGTADAGTGVSDDPSVQFYNPAGMAYFKQKEVGLSAIAILPDISFKPKTATNYSEQPITGSNEGPGQDALIPAGYFIKPIDDKLVLGFGLTVPFGLSTNYDRNSIARYFATLSKIATFNLNPSFAYKFTNWFSFGAGFDAQHINATLNQAFDYGSIYPGQSDVYVKNNASAWGYGWNAGVQFRPFATTRIGLSYRSQIRYHLTGKMTVSGIDYSNPSDAGVAGFWGLTNSTVKGDITMPSYTTLSLQQDVTPRWKLMADAEYISWNVIPQIALRFQNKNPANNSLPTAVTLLEYKNTWRTAIGQSYQMNSIVTWRMGLAYDQSPVRRVYATARIPDSDRYWVNLGIGFHMTKKADMNLAYSHIFFKNSSVNQSLNTGLGTTAQFAANYKGHADLFGIQFNYHWD